MNVNTLYISDMKLTRHGKERSEEREIYPEMMARILSGKYIAAPSSRDESAQLVTGKCDGTLWTIVVDIDTGKVITARRAHGKEIKLYEERLGRS